MTEKDFLENGFKKENDPMFKFRKELVDWDEVENNDLSFDDIPCLLYGATSQNRCFCVYTGEHFIWLNSTTIKDAVDFAEKIVAFDSV